MTKKRQDKAVDLVNALFDAEHHFLDLVLDFIPEEARRHMNAARKERLLALRSFLDNRIRSLEEEEKDTGKRKSQKVKVEAE